MHCLSSMSTQVLGSHPLSQRIHSRRWSWYGEEGEGCVSHLLCLLFGVDVHKANRLLGQSPINLLQKTCDGHISLPGKICDRICEEGPYPAI